jgi:hypothetical protein
MAETDTELALNALRDTLRAVDARPSDRVRAAEAILRLAQGNGPGASDLIELSDDALLLIARGEGGTPREMGPTVPALETVPSRAVEPPGLALPAAKPNPFMQRGPKEDPAPKAPRGVPLAMGPKEDPDPWT